MERKASAIWNGDLKSGTGRFSSESGVFKDTPYSFKTRFENEPGTNPEELIAAAHASCFSMALSAQLAQRSLDPQEIRTQATVTFEKVGEGFAITRSHLDLTAKLGSVDEAAFQEAAKAAKEGCPISKALNAEITLDAKLA